MGEIPSVENGIENILPPILLLCDGINFILSKTKCYRGVAPLALYIYISGTKKETH
jgi:hypothetical protein